MTRGRIRARPEQQKKQPSGCCSCGGRIRTCDLQVMSLASYQLLHSAMLFLSGDKISASRMQRARSLLRRSLISQTIFLNRLQRYEDFSNYTNIYAVFLKKRYFNNFFPLFSCSIQRKKLILHTVIAMCNPLIQGGAKVCQYPKQDRN